ncbi:hypothetical protein B0G81_3811 [Paraburkholderia sp. BL6665CI2N2]|nr:hypothetical protein B0G81_3811 [Paraburkholderia sp. BL6665CI2N2]
MFINENNFGKDSGDLSKNSVTADEVPYYNTTLAQINSYCYGDEFKKLLGAIVDVFGTPSESQSYPEKDTTSQTSPVFSIGKKTYCKDNNKTGCKVRQATGSGQVYTFNGLGNVKLTLSASKSSAIRQIQRDGISVENHETRCLWLLNFIPK